eukprot:GILJ01004973.1.p1 GENE.GILJ01004973.1~~GILJ01004973.1.p1  ORF type:complete len:817 (+),score=151.65 GILJ01004973.1:177-2627(+)
MSAVDLEFSKARSYLKLHQERKRWQNSYSAAEEVPASRHIFVDLSDWKNESAATQRTSSNSVVDDYNPTCDLSTAVADARQLLLQADRDVPVSPSLLKDYDFGLVAKSQSSRAARSSSPPASATVPSSSITPPVTTVTLPCNTALPLFRARSSSLTGFPFAEITPEIEAKTQVPLSTANKENKLSNVARAQIILADLAKSSASEFIHDNSMHTAKISSTKTPIRRSSQPDLKFLHIKSTGTHANSSLISSAPNTPHIHNLAGTARAATNKRNIPLAPASGLAVSAVSARRSSVTGVPNNNKSAAAGCDPRSPKRPSTSAGKPSTVQPSLRRTQQTVSTPSLASVENMVARSQLNRVEKFAPPSSSECLELLSVEPGIEQRITMESMDESRLSPSGSKKVDHAAAQRVREKERLKRQILTAQRRLSAPPASTTDFYTFGKLLGKGAFGKVNQGTQKLTGETVAIKMIDKSAIRDGMAKRRIMQEVTILKRLVHPNLIRLYEVIESSKHIILVMEYAGGGDLLTYVRSRGKLQEAESKRIFKQLVRGVEYCHSRSVIHRDIKLENVLLDEFGDVKLADFGVSAVCKVGKKLLEHCGTPSYIAPEIILDRGYEGLPVDVWSMGVVLFAMTCGHVPFKGENMIDLQRKIVKGKFVMPEHLSADAKDLFPRLLNVDPTKRISIEDLLQHPWLQTDEHQTTGRKMSCDSANLDEEIVTEVSHLGYTRDFLVKSLDTKEFNHATTCYQLLVDKAGKSEKEKVKQETGTVSTAEPAEGPFDLEDLGQQFVDQKPQVVGESYLDLMENWMPVDASNQPVLREASI